MNFEIKYTLRARQDLRNIYNYIAHDLQAPEAAVKQTQYIMKKIETLNKMPMRYRLYYDEPWHSQGVRITPVNKYLVLYLPDKTTTQFTLSVSFTVEEISINS